MTTPTTPPPLSTTTTDAALASIEWLDATGSRYEAAADPALLDQELYRASRIREGHNYRGRRHYAGLHWFSNTAQHVWYESMMERRALLWLDFTSDIVAIAAQPMRISFPDGTHHVPDFLALHSDHRQVLYNVKPTKFITEKVQTQFANADETCATVGWSHSVVSDFDEIVIANVEWLSNFRQQQFAPPAAVRTLILDTLDATPMVVHDIAELLTDAPWAARTAAIYHLVWHGYVTLDLSVSLSLTSLVRKATS